MGHHELDTNVLIMGKTGVGKSSFINYLYPAAKRETGAGRPITGRGIYRSVLRLGNDLAVNLYDTWGLEAGHAAEWKDIILDEVRKHDMCDIKDWFHTIIYCLSAKSARVEYFETEQINMLRRGGNRVIVVLTHCDLNNVSGAIDKMTEILRGECGLVDEDIIRASSVHKKLLGGALKEPFGRDAAIERITANLWKSIVEKIPPLLRANGEASIERWHEKCLSLIDKNIHFFNHMSNDAIRSLTGKINRRARDCGADFSKYAGEKFDEAVTYYKRLRGKYEEISNDYFERAALDLPRFYSFAEDESAEEKVITACAMIIVPFVIPFVADFRRDELKEDLTLFKSQMEDWLGSYIDEVSERLMGGAEADAAPSIAI
jgi:GTP-binding protein EngB required for normal cell division